MRMNTPPREDDIIDSIEDGLIEELDDFPDDGSDWEEEDNDSYEIEDSEDTESLPDMAEFVFPKHHGSVFSCSISPNKEICASGGEDDAAYLWTTEGENLFTITGHKDSVTCIEFSHDGSLLASADMSGYIQVFKVSTLTKVWEFETGDLIWLIWHPLSNILFGGTNEGEVWMWLIPKGDTKSFPSFGVSAQCAAVTKDGKRLAVGYDDGTISIFDLKSGQKIQSFGDNGGGHESTVVSLSCHKDNNLILSGSMDGYAKVLNSNSGKVIHSLVCEIDEHWQIDENATVEVVSFCPTIANVAVTATLSGFISIWDISSGKVRHHIVQGNGTSKIIWHPTQPIFFASSLDGILRSYDARSGDLLNKYSGHKKSILDISIKKDGSKLISSSDDGTVRIFKSLENESN